MKKFFKLIGIIALVAVIGFSMAACGGDGDDDNNSNNNVNNNGNGNGSDSKPTVSYIITGSGTSFTAAKSGATVGTADTPQKVITAIKSDANGANVAIQFGNGTSVLNNGSYSIIFSNASEGTWGSITISGKITASFSVIGIMNGVSVTSTADITCTNATGGSNSYAITIYNNATLTINSGTISAQGNAIYNLSGTLKINGGTVSTTGSETYAINNSGGTVTISPSAVITGNKSGY